MHTASVVPLDKQKGSSVFWQKLDLALDGKVLLWTREGGEHARQKDATPPEQGM